MHKEEQRGFRKAWTRCGRAGPQRMEANYSGRHRRRHPAMVSIGSRTQVPHSRTRCTEIRLAENMGAPHKHSSTRRNLSAGSTRGSQLATCSWGGGQDGRQDRCRTHLTR
jgi:hypothetical protein